MLLHPVFADYLTAYGAKGAEAAASNALTRLARLDDVDAASLPRATGFISQ